LEKVTLCHKRLKFPNLKKDYYNPLLFLFDLEIRDIAEYIKSSFFKSEKDAWIELKSFLKTNIAPTKIETFIAESKKNINSKYERLTDIKDAYSTISGNKLAATNITINNNVYNKNNVITDLITKYNNLDSQTKAHLVLYNSFYKPWKKSLNRILFL